MDSLTHIVTGAIIGEAVLGKVSGKKAMFWGALAASAPDCDAVLNFLVSDVDSLVMHRGITHSVFVAMVAGPLAGFGLSRIYSGRSGTAMQWIMMITLALFSHLFLDTCTVYGTGLLTPFSDYRYSFDNIYVADPLYTLPFLVAFVALLYLRRNHPMRGRWLKFAFINSSIYMAFTFYNHRNALEAGKRSLEKMGANPKSMIATPTLMNGFLWHFVAADSSGYWSGYWSVFDENQFTPELTWLPQNIQLADEVEDKITYEKMVNFSNGYFTLSRDEGAVRMNVLRFGQVAGWMDPHSKGAFSFDLTPGADNSMVVQQGRLETTRKEVLTAMFERLKGRTKP